MTNRIEVVKSEGWTVSRLVWALLKRKPLGFTEKVLDVNPGLAEKCKPFIPVGAAVVFPLDQIKEDTVNTEVIRLWD